MFASVICIDASLDHTPLTYGIPEHLSSVWRGNIVSVPFRDELVHAIVVDIFWEMPPDISEEEIKPVVSVEVSREVLAGYQLDAVLGIAKTFFLHAHKALSLFLTAPYLRQSLKKWGNMIDENTPCSSEENPTTSRISGVPPQKIELVFPKEWASLVKYIQEISVGEENIYIVFPFEKDAKKAYEILPDALRENILLVEDGLPEVKEFRVRETIISGKYRFVFGDRRILLYNAEKYTRIVYVDDTLAGTFMRSFHILPNTFLLESFAHSGKKVSIFSTIPRVADWVSVKKESWTFHSFS